MDPVGSGGFVGVVIGTIARSWAFDLTTDRNRATLPVLEQGRAVAPIKGRIAGCVVLGGRMQRIALGSAAAATAAAAALA